MERDKTMNKLRTPLIVLSLFSVGAFSQERVSNERIQNPDLKDYLPLKVNLLRESLSETFLAGKSNMANADSRYIRRAKEQALEWVLKTVNRDWLPADPNILREDIIMIQNAFGPNDVTYLKWETRSEIVRVAQTKTIILIQVQPKSPEQEPKLTMETRKLLARNVISSLFNKEVDIEVIEPTTSKIVKKTIMPELLVVSFDRANVQVYAGGIHGKCGELVGQNSVDYNFWWRRIEWWTDGQNVWIYTLKTGGGAWEADYDSTLDETWFEGPKLIGKDSEK